MSRYFKLLNHLTMPRSVLPGRGNRHVRPAPGDIVKIDDGACARESRFINGRLRAGDMKEATEAEYLEFVKAREAQNAPAPVEPAPTAKAAKGK